MTSSNFPSTTKSDPSPTRGPVSETFSETGPHPHSTHAIRANLDFEYELAHPTTDYKTPPPVLNFIERWNHILRLMPGFENARALTPHTKTPQQITHLLPWGATPTATSTFHTNFPDFATVKHVNDKRFSHTIEKNAGIDLPHSRIVANLEELELAAQACPFDWVAKHPLGVSGRERILGKAHNLDPQLAKWATRQFQSGWQLVFEPWVKIDHEYSLQFHITPDQEIHFLGTLELLTDTVGTFRGHISLQHDTSNHQTALQLAQTAHPLLTQLAHAGYHGPVGLDALTGHLGPQPITRPITEINARITFGRLALELAKYVPPTYKYIWWHPSKSAAKAANLQILGPLTPHATTPGAYHLPTHADPHARSQTLVLIAPPNTPFPHIF